MTSAAAIAQELAVGQVSPNHHRQHQSPRRPQQGHHPQNSLYLSPMLNSPPCGTINSNNDRMNTGTREVILDWAKSMNTSSSNLAVISSPDLFSAAAAAAAAMASSSSYNSNKNYKNKLSSQNNKKRKNHPIATAGSPRTTMIAPPMVLNLDQEFQQQQPQPQELSSPVTGVGAGDEDLGAPPFFPAVHASNGSSSSADAAAGAPLLASSGNPNPAKKVKRWGGLVQRTHSPQRFTSSQNNSATMLQTSSGAFATSTNVAPIRLQLVTPTVEGIHHVALHLLGDSTSSAAFAAIPQMNTSATIGNFNGNKDKEHPLVAMPTECTYEAIALIDWNKTEALSPSLETLREDRLRHCKCPPPQCAMLFSCQEQPCAPVLLRSLAHLRFVASTSAMGSRGGSDFNCFG
jgi:hypothetical protein